MGKSQLPGDAAANMTDASKRGVVNLMVRRLALVLMALVVWGGTAIGTAGAASATSPALTSASPLYVCAGVASPCNKSMGTMTAGAVSMTCWEQVSEPTGKHMWFYVTRGAQEGWVRAGDVAHQVTVKNCITAGHAPVWAAAWAIAQVGKTIDVGKCLTFVDQAYKSTSKQDLAPWTTSSTNPVMAWNHAGKSKQHGKSDLRWKTPPRGAWVYWGSRPGSPDGHVALSLGNGWLVSTSEGTTPGTAVHFLTISHRNSWSSAVANSYLGWTLGAV